MLYLLLDNSIYIIGFVCILHFILKYRTEKLGCYDTDRVHEALFLIYYSKKCKLLKQWVNK